MAVPRPRFAFALAVRLLLAGLGWSALAGTVHASGCHESERPTFGMTPSQFRAPIFPDTGPEPIANPSPRLDRARCPGEQPGPSPRSGFTEPCIADSSPLDPPAIPTSLAVESGSPQLPLRSPTSLERPPRLGPIDRQG